MASAPLVVRGLTRFLDAGVPGCRARVRALDALDLTVAAGEIVAVVGVAGSGKTTLAHVARGVLAPDRGVVDADRARLLVLDDDPRGATADRLARLARRCRRAANAGAGVLVVSRDRAVGAFATRLLHMKGGRLYEADTVTDALARTRVAEPAADAPRR